MATRTDVLVLGAGFGGLELATRLSEELGDSIDVTLIDRNEGFHFGFSKLDVMFGRSTLESTFMAYRDIARPGVTFRRETVLSIDPDSRTVVTDADTYRADRLVVALGADYDVDATPGLAESGGEFYSVAGAASLAPRIATFEAGHAVIGVCGAPYKCPPAPSETALLLHEQLVTRGVRDACTITFLVPFASPIPPSPDTSAALLEAFAERDIDYRLETRVVGIDNERDVVLLDDGSELAFDLFLGVPRHRAPSVVIDAGMTEDDYVPVDARTLETRWPKVHALGDVAAVGTPMAGVFAERQAGVVADAIIAELRGESSGSRFDGTGECWLEFGEAGVARVEVDFFRDEGPTAAFRPPSAEFAQEKRQFGASRRARWFTAR